MWSGLNACYECKSRKVGCHSTCKPFLLACEKRRECKKKLREVWEADGMHRMGILRALDAEAKHRKI